MNENGEPRLTSAEKRAVLRRALKAVGEADRGHMARETLSHIIGLSSDFFSILLSALVIDGITRSKPAKTLIIYAAVVVGIRAALTAIQLFLLRRRESHRFTRNENLHKSLWTKAMTMDFARLEDAGTRDMYAQASRQPENDHAGVAALCGNFRTMAGGIFMIAAGALMICPSVFGRTTGASGFEGFVMSAWGFLAVAAAVSALEILKSAVITPMGMVGFEKTYNDINVIRAGRKDTFFNDHVLKNYRNGKEIRIYSQQGLIEGELDNAQDTLSKGWFGGYKRAMLPNILFHLVTVFTKFIMYGFAVLRAMGGMLTAGEVIAFALCFEKISAGVAMVSESLGMMKVIPMFCGQYFDFLDLPDEKSGGSVRAEKGSGGEYEFELRNVWFRYPGTEQYVLRGVDLKWRTGEKMALVGKNGSGKSTLIKLLCRLYEPTEGEILLNGTDIREYDYDDYMAMFSVVFQDSGLFSFSIAENVAAGAGYDAERVRDCVRRSGLSERLDSLPAGIETFLYKDFDENGVEISGGEAQKLCLARAVYKGAPFIVLDEPTAALDPVSEHEIYTKFNSITGTRTAVYISHRLSSCRFCDEIIVMEAGRIVERGSHEALTAAGGIYAGLWSAQAEYYRDTAGALFE